MVKTNKSSIKVLLVLIILLKLNSQAGENPLIGIWYFIDSNDNYCELYANDTLFTNACDNLIFFEHDYQVLNNKLLFLNNESTSMIGEIYIKNTHELIINFGDTLIFNLHWLDSITNIKNYSNYDDIFIRRDKLYDVNNDSVINDLN